MRPARRRSRRSRRRSRHGLAAGALAAWLGGCTLGPDFVAPPPPASASFLPGGPAADLRSAAAGLGAAAAQLPPDWWTLLGDADLDALVARALANSPGVAGARATLARAEELRRAGAGVFWPAVSVAAASSRQQGLAQAGAAPVALGPYSVSTAATAVSYPLDVFGGQRRAVENLGAQADRARADLQAARLAVAANLANAVIAGAGYRAQVQALDELGALQDDQIGLAQSRFDAGVGTWAAVLSLRSARNATRAAVATARHRAALAQTLVARLCGDEPARAGVAPVALADLRLPAAPPLELPAAWIGHRPDILGARADLHAANAAIGVATAALLPDLTLSAQAGRATGSLGSVPWQGVGFWSWEAALAGPVFDGGARQHARRAALAAREAAAAQYRQVVLQALEDVADALRSVDDDHQVLLAQEAAAADAGQALAIARAQWQAGGAGYLDVLAADAQLRSARLAVVDATAQRLQDAVALYVALGGGWWNASGPGADTP